MAEGDCNEAKQEGPKKTNINTELAMTRTTLALDRTLLAWIRTSLALLGFGFTFAKYVHTLIQHSTLKDLNLASPRTLGLVLMSLGVLGIAGGVFQYFKAHHHLRCVSPASSISIWSPTIIMAIILLAASLIMTISMMLKTKIW